MSNPNPGGADNEIHNLIMIFIAHVTRVTAGACVLESSHFVSLLDN